MEPMEIGSMTLFPYGAVTALALGAGVLWSRRAARGERGRKTAELFWLMALPLGLALAHLGWALCNLDMIEDMFWETLADFPAGGYLLYGALAGAALALTIACRATGEKWAEAADALAGPFLLLGAACALADGLTGGGSGWKVADWFDPENSMSLFAMESPSFFESFPFAVRDPFYGYANWAVFLPVALGLGLGLWPLSRLGTGRPGNRAVFSLGLYASVRILYESLRQDDIPKWGFVRCNQILSAVLLLLLVCLCVRAARKRGKEAAAGWPRWIGLLLGGAALVLVMEFALEGKIGFLEWMTMDLCYLVSAAGCAMMFLSVNLARRRALGKESVSAGEAEKGAGA